MYGNQRIYSGKRRHQRGNASTRSFVLLTILCLGMAALIQSGAL